MSSLTVIDAASRTMAKKKWIQAATESGKGVFKKKAERAGETTREYAEQESNAPGKLGKEARLAKSLMGMSKSRGLYSRKD